jgi:hypothetical protein
MLKPMKEPNLASPKRDAAHTAPRLTIIGYETRSYRLNPTVASYLISKLQANAVGTPGPPLARDKADVPYDIIKFRHFIDLEREQWHVQVAGLPAGFDAVRRCIEMVRDAAGCQSAASLDGFNAARFDAAMPNLESAVFPTEEGWR